MTVRSVIDINFTVLLEFSTLATCRIWKIESIDKLFRLHKCSFWLKITGEIYRFWSLSWQLGRTPNRDPITRRSLLRIREAKRNWVFGKSGTDWSPQFSSSNNSPLLQPREGLPTSIVNERDQHERETTEPTGLKESIPHQGTGLSLLFPVAYHTILIYVTTSVIYWCWSK